MPSVAVKIQVWPYLYIVYRHLVGDTLEQTERGLWFLCVTRLRSSYNVTALGSTEPHQVPTLTKGHVTETIALSPVSLNTGANADILNLKLISKLDCS